MSAYYFETTENCSDEDHEINKDMAKARARTRRLRAKVVEFNRETLVIHGVSTLIEGLRGGKQRQPEKTSSSSPISPPFAMQRPLLRTMKDNPLSLWTVLANRILDNDLNHVLMGGEVAGGRMYEENPVSSTLFADAVFSSEGCIIAAHLGTEVFHQYLRLLLAAIWPNTEQEQLELLVVELVKRFEEVERLPLHADRGGYDSVRDFVRDSASLGFYFPHHEPTVARS